MKLQAKVNATMIILSAVSLLCFKYLFGCSSDIRAKTFATARDALSRDAVLAIQIAAVQAAQTGHVDFAHAAAEALWANGASDARSVLEAATDGKVPKLVGVAVQAVEHLTRNNSPESAAATVAAVISDAALTLQK